jgi:hypothetical protein
MPGSARLAWRRSGRRVLCVALVLDVHHHQLPTVAVAFGPPGQPDNKIVDRYRHFFGSDVGEHFAVVTSDRPAGAVSRSIVPKSPAGEPAWTGPYSRRMSIA